jgi:hypothetical protein
MLHFATRLSRLFGAPLSIRAFLGRRVAALIGSSQGALRRLVEVARQTSMTSWSQRLSEPSDQKERIVGSRRLNLAAVEPRHANL